MSISISSFSIVSVVILPITQHFFPDHPEVSEMIAESCHQIHSGVPPNTTVLHEMPDALSPGFSFAKQIFFGPFVIALLVVASRRIITLWNTTFN